MATYRISQLAERSGVPATTLRFYETAGLLPAERTASGYRVYGEDAVDRLAFISSAKLLGLALDEIRALLDVREEGVCASVRARMLPLPTQAAESETWRDAPVACTLDGAELGERTEQWRELVAKADRREPVDEGVRLSFPPHPELAGRIAELAAAEQGCCAFFDFTLHLTPTALQLTVRAPEGAAGMLNDLFGEAA